MGVNVGISENIKNARQERHFTQAELGEMLGVGRSTIARYESGELMPPTQRLIDMHEIFGYSLMDEIPSAKGVAIPDMKMPRSCWECPFMRMEFSYSANLYIAFCPLIRDELVHGISKGRTHDCPLEEY